MSCAAAGMAASVRNASNATTNPTAAALAIGGRHLKKFENTIIGQPSTKPFNLNMEEKGEGRADDRSLSGAWLWLRSKGLIY